ncbi:hypothetical protein [Nocardia sp. SYP-A9097]|uniref:hypothetical protein n=1 Tax=Nocardia sp. SYP-A9097 TaxID=2663237 RepID=UPI0018915031|nr:hypothetical protein [Nocardia sp. SYP-A9097]
MIEVSQNWPTLPLFEMELKALQLRSDHEIRVQGDSYGVTGGDVTVSMMLSGTPVIIFDVASVPLSHVKQFADGHPIVLGEDSVDSRGGLRYAPSFPGLPIGPLTLFSIPLLDGGECRVQAHGHRTEDGFAFFSVNCETPTLPVSYDLASIPITIIRQRSGSELDIRIVD